MSAPHPLSVLIMGVLRGISVIYELPLFN